MAFNGRHLSSGSLHGSKRKGRPLPIQPSIYGTFDLVGICIAYVDSPRPARRFGMNFVSAAGIDIWDRILHLTRAGTIRPVIGRHIDFTEVPSGLESLERRATIGRTVVRTPQDPGGTPGRRTVGGGSRCGNGVEGVERRRCSIRR